MKWSTRMPLLNDGPWISCGLLLGPMTSRQGMHAKACCTRHPMPKQCHKARRTETWSTKRKTVAFAQFHLYIFYLQKAHNSFSIFSFSFAKLYFLLQYFKSLANICGIVLTPYKGRIQFTCHRGLFTNISQWCLTENTVLKIKWVSFFYYCHFAPGLCLRLRFVHRLMHSGVSALFFTVLSIFVKEFSCLFLKLVSQLTIANSEKPGLIYGVVWDRL